MPPQVSNTTVAMLFLSQNRDRWPAKLGALVQVRRDYLLCMSLTSELTISLRCSLYDGA